MKAFGIIGGNLRSQSAALLSDGSAYPMPYVRVSFIGRTYAPPIPGVFHHSIPGGNRRMPDAVRLHQPDLGDREQLPLQRGERAGHGGSCRVVHVPPTISRQSLPLSFTATADDLCGAHISFGNFQCYEQHDNGRTTPRQCVTVAAGDTVTIERAEGTRTIVSWDLTATDPAGNSTTIGCRTETENNP